MYGLSEERQEVKINRIVDQEHKAVANVSWPRNQQTTVEGFNGVVPAFKATG